MKRLLMFGLAMTILLTSSYMCAMAQKVSALEFDKKKSPYEKDGSYCIPVTYKTNETSFHGNLQISLLTGRSKNTGGYKLTSAKGYIDLPESMGEKIVSLRSYPAPHEKILSGWISENKVNFEDQVKRKKETKSSSGSASSSLWNRYIIGGAVATTLLLSFVVYKYLAASRA